MSQLRLVDNNGKTIPTDRLPFPTEAVRVMARQRLERIATRVTPSTTGQSLEGFEAFAAELERRLDQTQQQLDQLRQQVDSYPIFKARHDDTDTGGGGRAA